MSPKSEGLDPALVAELDRRKRVYNTLVAMDSLRKEGRKYYANPFSGELRCIRCAGSTLSASIAADPLAKQFHSINGEPFNPMSVEDVLYFRQQIDELGPGPLCGCPTD